MFLRQNKRRKNGKTDRSQRLARRDAADRARVLQWRAGRLQDTNKWQSLEQYAVSVWQSNKGLRPAFRSLRAAMGPNIGPGGVAGAVASAAVWGAVYKLADVSGKIVTIQDNFQRENRYLVSQQRFFTMRGNAAGAGGAAAATKALGLRNEQDMWQTVEGADPTGIIRTIRSLNGNTASLQGQIVESETTAAYGIASGRALRGLAVRAAKTRGGRRGNPLDVLRAEQKAELEDLLDDSAVNYFQSGRNPEVRARAKQRYAALRLAHDQEETLAENSEKARKYALGAGVAAVGLDTGAANARFAGNYREGLKLDLTRELLTLNTEWRSKLASADPVEVGFATPEYMAKRANLEAQGRQRLAELDDSPAMALVTSAREGFRSFGAGENQSLQQRANDLMEEVAGTLDKILNKMPENTIN